MPPPPRLTEYAAAVRGPAQLLSAICALMSTASPLMPADVPLPEMQCNCTRCQSRWDEGKYCCIRPTSLLQKCHFPTLHSTFQRCRSAHSLALTSTPHMRGSVTQGFPGSASPSMLSKFSHWPAAARAAYMSLFRQHPPISLRQIGLVTSIKAISTKYHVCWAAAAYSLWYKRVIQSELTWCSQKMNLPPGFRTR